MFCNNISIAHNRHSNIYPQTTTVGNSKAKADREAYAALLAQQKMMTVLDSHKEASEKQRILLAEEVSELSSAHKEMVAECLKYVNCGLCKGHVLDV